MRSPDVARTTCRRGARSRARRESPPALSMSAPGVMPGSRPTPGTRRSAPCPTEGRPLTAHSRVHPQDYPGPAGATRTSPQPLPACPVRVRCRGARPVPPARPPSGQLSRVLRRPLLQLLLLPSLLRGTDRSEPGHVVAPAKSSGANSCRCLPGYRSKPFPTQQRKGEGGRQGGRESGRFPPSEDKASRSPTTA